MLSRLRIPGEVPQARGGHGADADVSRDSPPQCLVPLVGFDALNRQLDSRARLPDGADSRRAMDRTAATDDFLSQSRGETIIAAGDLVVEVVRVAGAGVLRCRDERRRHPDRLAEISAVFQFALAEVVRRQTKLLKL